MECFGSDQLIKKQRVVRLSIPLGLAMLFVMILIWVLASGIPVKASPFFNTKTIVLKNDNVITIGVAVDLSGPVGEFGWRQANAVQLAISQTNTAGGIEIGGVPYTLTAVIADSACDATQAVTAANSLLNAGAVAIVGHSCSDASFQAQPIYYAAGVPMVSPSSSNIYLTEQGYNTTFRVFPKDDAQARLMATNFRQSLRMDAVALVEWSSFEFSTEAFSNTFTSLGGVITSRRTVTSTNDYAAILTAIQMEHPNAVFYADSNPNNSGFLSTVAHNLGLGIIGWDPIFGEITVLEDYATVAGTAAEEDYVGFLGRQTDNMPGYVEFNAAYQTAAFPNSGDEAQMWGAYAYDAAGIIIDAIGRADSTNPIAIRNEIASTTNYEGVVGTYDGFDAKGDVIPQWSWLESYQNGGWRMVLPYKVTLPLVFNISQ